MGNTRLNIIKYFDIFANSPTFLYKGNLKINTICGQILSLFIVISFIILSILLSIDFIFHKNPIISYYSNNLLSNKTNFNNSNFLFGFVFFMSNGTQLNISDEIIYYENNYHISNSYNGNVINYNETIYFEKCNKEHFNKFDISSNELQNYLIKKGLCLNFNNTLFKGSPFNDFNFNGFSLLFGYKTQIYYDYYSKYKNLFPLTVKIFFQTTSFEPNNFHNPMKKKIGTYDAYLSDSYAIQYISIFSLKTLKRDENFFFNKKNKTNFYSFSNMENSQITRPQFGKNEGKEAIFNLKIYLDNTKIIFSRQYKKIQDIIAQIVSILQVEYFIIRIFIMINGNSVIKQLYYDYFNVENNKDKKNKICYNKNIVKKEVIDLFSNNSQSQKILLPGIMDLNNHFNNSNYCCRNNSKYNVFTYENGVMENNLSSISVGLKINEKLNLKKKSFKFFICFCDKGIDKKNHNKGKLIIIKFLDILNYFKNLEDMRFLKMIYLEPEQYYSFNYMIKNNLTNNDNIIDYYEKGIGLNSLIDYYKYKIINKKMTDKDAKIISLLEKSIKDKINKNIN